MTAQLLASELGNLIQESKRKNNDLRQASEKALDELKNLRDSSEARVGGELSQHSNFVNPFILACGTRNARFTGIAVVCLQRLVSVGGVPRSRLDQVLQALREASGTGGLDVQLRILQSLPLLLQMYARDVAGDLLVTALNICFVLQASKNVVVNNTASATLQQLLIAVFDKVAEEDEHPTPPVGEAPVQNGAVKLRQAALDAFHIFHDVCLLTEGGRPEYLRFSSLPATFGLELIESVLTNHPAIFASHPEQTQILRAKLMPYLVQTLLRPKTNFPTAVRLVRVLYTILRRHLVLLAVESGEALAALTQVLDQETALWKRVLCMEAFKGLFSEHALLRQIYMLYDDRAGDEKKAKTKTKTILQDLLATFVRVSTERPSVIGLSHQSTIPVSGGSAGGGGSSSDQAVLEASGGVSGLIGNAVTTVGSEGNSTGISSQWSAIRTPCIDQLDKAEPLPIPESYIFSLIVACMTSLSEGLAKFILPLTVPGESRHRKRSVAQEASAAAAAATTTTTSPTLERSTSFKKNPVPVNPLQLQGHPLQAEVQAYADMIDRCWPAILATCSTFLYSALDAEYYHSLVRAFQRFTHVAGLLQLDTPRDAFLTTLGKAAVPPNVLTACLNGGGRPSTPTTGAPPDTPTTTTANGIFNNARGLLSVDSLGSTNDKQRSAYDASSSSLSSSSSTSASLNTRNLLCLRALLNLGIALGPTLEGAWQIVLETLQQADFVLFCSGKAAGRTPTAVQPADAQAEAEASALLANFGSEIRAVETAASRLFESTVDFPNAAFVEFIVAICSLLEKSESHETEKASVSQQQQQQQQQPLSPTPSTTSLRTPVIKHKRVMSISTTASATTTASDSNASGLAPINTSQAPSQEDQFVLAKLGDVASINLERLLYYPPDVSGWDPLTSEITRTLASATTAAAVRLRAAETLVRLVLEAVAALSAEAVAIPRDMRGKIQLQLLETLQEGIAPFVEDGDGSEDRDNREPKTIATVATDVDIHKTLLDGLKSLLEDGGETLVRGWDVVFAIIDSIFLVPDHQGSGLATRSVRLIKPSFASVQLICSDFLPSLPNTCYLNLVDTLYKFCTQGDDLNVALTTVTFYWTISDFLLSQSSPLSITAAVRDRPATDDALVQLACDTSHPGAAAALWMLLLLRLSAVTTDHRLELRNSAVQTLLRIIHAYGHRLTAEDWSVCTKAVLFRLLSSTEGQLRLAREKRVDANKTERTEKTEKTEKKDKTDWNDTAVVIVQGVSGLLANYLDVLATHAVFADLWTALLAHFATLLDFGQLAVSTAVFGSLDGMLAKDNDDDDEESTWSFDKKTVQQAWELWSRGVPVPKTEEPAAADNQTCLVAWVEALVDIERLMRPDLDLAKTQRMMRLLRDAVVVATPGSYASDVEYTTPLQSRILTIFHDIRSDIPGAPSAVITQLAEFASMAFAVPTTNSTTTTSTSTSTNKRTFVALSKGSMALLEQHVTRNADDADIFVSGAFAAALTALAKPIALKYQFPIATKSTPPWREAVRATLAILEATLDRLQAISGGDSSAAFQKAWDVIVVVSNGILRADLHHHHQRTEEYENMVTADETFDIQAFRQLRSLVIPALGSAAVAETTRRAYVQGLFRISIVHAPAPADAALIFGGGGDDDEDDDDDDDSEEEVKLTHDLTKLYRPGRGRTVDPTPARRSAMSYVCLDELFSLVAQHESETSEARKEARKETKTSEARKEARKKEESEDSKKYVRLAQTAAPFLIVRCALTLRSYVADQPLRGHMPQPASQRRELARLLRQLVDLRSEPGAIPALAGVDSSEAGKHLLRLYPLLVRAAGVAGTAGDDQTLALAEEALTAVGGELGVV